MPFEKIVEYKIALPINHMFDLVTKVGELSLVHIETRPEVLPVPKIPSEIVDKVRKCEEISSEISKSLRMLGIEVELTRPVDILSLIHI